MLITVDGIDGSGKTTLAESLARQWEQLTGRRSVFVPAFSVRKYTEALLRGKSAYTKSEDVADCLYNLAWFGDAIRSVYDTITPLLDSKVDVFTDRYILSLRVYAIATTRDCLIQDLFPLYSHLPKPVLGFYLDLPIEMALDRVRRRGLERSYYENGDHLSRVREEYHRQMPQMNYPIYRVDATENQQEVLRRAFEHLAACCHDDESC